MYLKNRMDNPVAEVIHSVDYNGIIWKYSF